MSVFHRLIRLGAACLLLVLWILVAGAPAGAAAQAGPDAAGLGVCGALTVSPGLAEPWPAGKGVRPGDTVSVTDKGLGCRFTPPGKPAGGQVLLEARLTRPTNAEGKTAVDRWHVPARRGEPAAVVYAFYPPGQVTPGTWTLEIYADDVRLAAKTFTVLGSEMREPAAPPPAEGETPSGPEQPSAASVALPAPGKTDPPSQTAAPSAPARPAPAAALQPAPGKAASPTQTAPPAAPVRPAPAAAPRPEAKLPPKARPEATGTPAATASPKPGVAGFYALQTGLFSDAANAAGQAARLRAKGLPACVAEEGMGKNRRYRVLAGRYGENRAALAARGEVKAAIGVTPLAYAVPPAQAAGLRCH
jgi:cell division protein FtsN